MPRTRGVHAIGYKPAVRSQIEAGRYANATDVIRSGLRLLDDTPRAGAGGKQIVFVHPQSTDGVLIEICAEPTRK